MQKAEIGIIGGTGFYSILSAKEELYISTPYGEPSDKITIGEIEGKNIAFLPRHGKKHTIPPHKINYRANIWALHSIGVTRLISPCACGSLKPHIKPGDFVVTDQFVDRTKNRKDTFYDGPSIAHISAAYPYCPELRELAIKAIRESNIKVHESGTIVIIEGPRFSTKAESEWFTKMGWDVVNMTQYPEVVLALEMGMCIVNIALVTDYDCGIAGNVAEVTTADVIATLKTNNQNLLKIIKPLVKYIPAHRTNCKCAKKIEEAKVSI